MCFFCWENEADEELTIFAVNKDLEEDLEVSCDMRQFADYKVVEHIILTNDDMKAVNTEDAPQCVVPVAGERLPPGGRKVHHRVR